MNQAVARRDVLKLAAAGLLPATGVATVVSNYGANPWGTPGLYAGRVVAMRHSGCTVDFHYQAAPIQQMIRSGLMALTGKSNHADAWRQFVNRGDVVGIKVNPNGNPATMSSPEVILEIIDGLMRAGVARERYTELLKRYTGWFPSCVGTRGRSPRFRDANTGADHNANGNEVDVS